jgi:NADPH2:quinone reductase
MASDARRGGFVKAIVCRGFEGPAALELADVAEPQPAAGEVVVEVSAAALNFADALMVRGSYQLRPPLPFIPGIELAGKVVALGEGVTRWKVGDRVMGSPAFGAYAERIAMAQDRLFAVPNDMADELACGFTVAYGTAGFALLDRGGLTAQDTVLVTGATGNVGRAALAISKRVGARTIAAVGSGARGTLALECGADDFVDYSAEGWVEQVKARSGGRGVSVILDNVGGAVFDKALRATAPEARVLVIGFASGTIPRIPAEYLMIKNIVVHGIGFGAMIANAPQRAKATLDRLLALHATQPFAPSAPGIIGLSGLPQALADMLDHKAAGQVVVRPGA